MLYDRCAIARDYVSFVDGAGISCDSGSAVRVVLKNQYEFSNFLSVCAFSNVERKTKSDADSVVAHPDHAMARRWRDRARRARSRAARWRSFFRTLSTSVAVVGGSSPPVASEPDRTYALTEYWKHVFSARPRRPECADRFLEQLAKPYDFTDCAPRSVRDTDWVLKRAKASAPRPDGTPAVGGTRRVPRHTVPYGWSCSDSLQEIALLWTSTFRFHFGLRMATRPRMPFTLLNCGMKASIDRLGSRTTIINALLRLSPMKLLRHWSGYAVRPSVAWSRGKVYLTTWSSWTRKLDVMPLRLVQNPGIHHCRLRRSYAFLTTSLPSRRLRILGFLPPYPNRLLLRAF